MVFVVVVDIGENKKVIHEKHLEQYPNIVIAVQMLATIILLLLLSSYFFMDIYACVCMYLKTWGLNKGKLINM